VLRKGGHAFVSSILNTIWYGVGFSLNKYHQITISSDHVREYRSKEEFAGLFRGHFRIVEIALNRFTLNIWGIYWRLSQLGLVKLDPKFSREKAKLFQLIELPRPGYFVISLLGQRV
jgi:hypothetical protein